MCLTRNDHILTGKAHGLYRMIFAGQFPRKISGFSDYSWEKSTLSGNSGEILSEKIHEEIFLENVCSMLGKLM